MPIDPGSHDLSSLLSILNDKPQSSFTSVANEITIDLMCKLLSGDDYVSLADSEKLSQPSDVMNLLEFILHVLRDRYLLDTDPNISEIKRRARHLMSKIISKTPVVPRSFIVTGVSLPEKHEWIGHGGFGSVYQGELRGTVVALKVLYKQDISKLAFRREALMWGSLKHEFVLPFIGINESKDGTTFLVSPYMKNGTLAQWRKNANTSIAQIEERILLEVAQGMEYIHWEGVVHGDLRGENILLDAAIHVQIADFGLTRVLDSTNSRSGAKHLHFAAPELFGCLGDPNDSDPARTQMSDVYAFGCLYYEIHYNKMPFVGRQDIQIMALVTQGKRPPRLADPPLVDDTWELIQQCWMSEPSKRPEMKDVTKQMMAISQSVSNARNDALDEISPAYSPPELILRPSPIFTGRTTYLQQLKKHLCDDSTNRKLFLLHGLGGIGKTQICLEFIAQNKKWFHEIFWIDASTEAKIDFRLKEIAKDNNISRESILHWISTGKKWLMVFDNVDGYQVVERFLPPGSGGNILITSKSGEFSRITSKENTVEVHRMDEEEAISLLLKSASISIDDSTVSIMPLASRIVSELGYIPLAIDQAGAYIYTNDCGLEEYLDLYANQRKELMSNSSFIGASNYGRSTYRTWEASMNKIESRATRNLCPAAQSAIILYKFFAFMNYDGISKDIFENAAKNYKQRNIKQERSLGLPLLIDCLDSKDLFLSEAEQWNELQFRGGIELLLSLSLIKSNNGLYSIHPLMHAWSRDRMTRADMSSAYHKAAALLSCSIEPIECDKDNDTHVLLCMQVIPHIQACYTHAGKLNFETMNFDDECGRFAFAFHRARNWEKAGRLYECMREARIAKLGEYHLSTLDTTHSLALTYRRVGKLEEARNLLKKVLESRKEQLGAEHQDTVATMHSLAVIYHKQGKVWDAENLYWEVLEKRRAALGVRHQETLDVMHNLGAVYLDQGRIKDAEELQSATMDGRMETLGESHTDTLSTMYNLALTLKQQHRMKEAEELQTKVLRIRKEKFGPRLDHPDILSVSYSLALTYKEQGKVDMAEKLEEGVLKAREENLGADHPDTLSIMHNLAVTYFSKGKIEESEKLLLKVVDKRKVKLGTEHPDTLSAIQNLEFVQREKEGLVTRAKKRHPGMKAILESMKNKLAIGGND